jgi:threonine dehydrogenase-like Zn-dependent dehydrogenase
VNAKSNDAVEQVKDITGGDMPTAVFDATGNLFAINNGINYLAHGGRYVLIGLQKEAFSFSHPDFHKREATLMSSRNATKADFEKVIGSIERKELNPNIFITDRVPFEDLPTAFPSFMGGESSTIKAMVTIS